MNNIFTFKNKVSMFSQFEDITSILLEVISEGIVIIDNHQTIVEVNTSTEEIFGYKKKDLISKNLNVLLPSHYHKTLSANFEGILKADNKVTIGDSKNIYGLKRDGEIIQMSGKYNDEILEYESQVILDWKEKYLEHLKKF